MSNSPEEESRLHEVRSDAKIDDAINHRLTRHLMENANRMPVETPQIAPIENLPATSRFRRVAVETVALFGIIVLSLVLFAMSCFDREKKLL